MPDANWYPDPSDPANIRYFDGTQWTEHTQPASAGSSAAETSPVSGDAGATATTDSLPVDALPKRTSSMATELISLAFVGAFIGIMLGGALLNGLGALSPLDIEQGTLDRLEIDISVSDSTNPDSRRTYLLGGTTDSGVDWQIADDDAYRIVDAEGYPQRVTIGIATWTGKAAQVTGESWMIDRQSTGNQISWGVAIGFMVVVGIIGMLITAKVTAHAIPGTLAFAIGFFVVGNWLGYRMFSWIQSV